MCACVFVCDVFGKFSNLKSLNWPRTAHSHLHPSRALKSLAILYDIQTNKLVTMYVGVVVRVFTMSKHRCEDLVIAYLLSLFTLCNF